METNFNFKSQICTSIEQSRRLLEFGLKKETADMCYKVTTHDFKGNEINEKDRHYTLCCWYDESSLVCGLERKETIPAWSLWRLCEMLPPSIKDGYHYSLIYDIHRDAIGYICFANGGLKRPYNRLLWDTQSTNPFDKIIVCIEWLIKEGYFNKEYLV